MEGADQSKYDVPFPFGSGPNVEITLPTSTTPDLDVRTLILSLGQLKANLPMVVRDHDLLFLDLFLKSIGLQRLFKICQGVTTALESGWHSASVDGSNISHQLCRYLLGPNVRDFFQSHFNVPRVYCSFSLKLTLLSTLIVPQSPFSFHPCIFVLLSLSLSRCPISFHRSFLAVTPSLGNSMTARELGHLLIQPHMRALLSAHDLVATKV